MMADNVKHTPGPWKLLTVGDRNRLCPADQNNHSILTLEDEGSSTFACVYEEADARLIAAAPDLLEALIDCVERFTAAFPAAENYEPIKKARAAIAKAEGRS